MENVSKEQQEDRRKNHYIVHVRRDTKLMKTFAEFKNRVEHPVATMYMVVMGVMLIGLMYKQADSIARVGQIIGYIFGAILVLMGLFRQYLSVWLMKNNPEVHVDEEITYLFGNTGIRAEKKGQKEEHLGYYKDVYCMWEDEATYYLGMSNDDLIVLPKAKFQKGNASEFKEYMLEKSGAKYVWKPTRIGNVCRNAILNMKVRITQMQMQGSDDAEDGK